jgi:hypothetical protein
LLRIAVYQPQLQPRHESDDDPGADADVHCLGVREAQRETTSQEPSSRLSHSSQFENVTIAMIDVVATRALLAQISIRAFSLVKTNSHGEANKNSPTVNL